MNKTKIEWAKNPDGTPGFTWNPITGCLNGCGYCYARKLANGRLKARYLANKYGVAANEKNQAEYYVNRDNPFYPRFWPDKLNPLTRKSPYMLTKSKGIFVCSMSDLFGIGIPEEWTRKVLEHIQWCNQHRFYLLTKQPQNLTKFSPLPDNCWVGVTATDTVAYSIAVKYLAHVSAKVKYLSIEPMQSRIITNQWELDRRAINWIIIGGQTSPTIQPKIEWVQEIVGYADQAGIPVFLKDSLEPLFEVQRTTACVQFTPEVADNIDLFYPIIKGTDSRILRQEMPNGQ